MSTVAASGKVAIEYLGTHSKSLVQGGLLVAGLYVLYLIIDTIIQTYDQRVHYKDLPSLPRHSVWGNLVNGGEKIHPGLGRHPDYGFEEIWEELGRPPCYLLDLMPVSGSFLICAEPQIAEQIVQPTKQYKYSVPKSETMSSISRLVGEGSLILAEGENWRDHRRRFNKGFAPNHLHSLTPLIIEKTRIFVDRMHAKVRRGEVFAMKDPSQDLIGDVITQLTIEEDYHAQTTPEGQGTKSPLGLLTASRIMSALAFKVGQGFDPVGFLDPIRPTKNWFYEKVFNHHIRTTLKRKLRAQGLLSSGPQPAKTQSPNNADQSSQRTAGRSIVELALTNVDVTSAVIENTVAQTKSFLFAGQDTTATTIQWILYEFNKTRPGDRQQEILSALSKEHDAVFGSHHPYTALDVLTDASQSASELILNSRLPYTTAVVKETLRLHPPAGTARKIPRAAKGNTNPPFHIMLEDRSIRVDGLRVYPCQHIMHRNHKVWGPDAHDFRPERWLDEKYISALPPGAWRPFERGPRNCIGQELALMELKVVVCAVARGLHFEKIGLTGQNGDREVWSINQVTSLPCDGMVMKVHFRDGGDRNVL